MTGGEASNGHDSLLRARSGDSGAFADLVRKQQRLVYSLALRMLSDRHKAEDLAQEVFMRLHRHLALIESPAHLMFWLRKVTTHMAIDRLRQAPRVEVVPLDRDPGIAEESNDRDPMLLQVLRTLVARLPPAPRAVVLLRYQEDLDPIEIAQTLDMPLNTVKSHLKRSLSVLREAFPGNSMADVENGA